MEVNFHGCGPAVEDLGYLGHRPVLQIVQGHALELTLRQRADGRPESGVTNSIGPRVASGVVGLPIAALASTEHGKSPPLDTAVAVV